MSHEPRLIPRSEHTISRRDFSRDALRVLYRLHESGFQAYLVGGGIRDLLLGKHPKDFDVATDAKPEQVRKLFRRARIIGRRFKIVHVMFGREYTEVATFRALHQPESEHEDVELDDEGRIVRDNRYGTLEEDSFRRDFTVNGLYYNIADFSLVDYVGGYQDMQDRRLRIIGEPERRYREDPVRMLRAARFTAKLMFDVDPDTAEPIRRLGNLLESIPGARLFDECLKLFLTGHGERSLLALETFRLTEALFPPRILEGMRADSVLVRRGLASTDDRVRTDQPVTPFFLFATFLWPAVQRRARNLEQSGMPRAAAMQRASAEVTADLQSCIAMPRRFTTPMNEMFRLQARFERTSGKRALALLDHPRFRAAYDFVLLRTAAGEFDQDIADHWTRAQDEMPLTGPGNDIPEEDDLGPPSSQPRRRRRRRRRPKSPEAE
jgi:poly(A) polymerase